MVEKSYIKQPEWIQSLIDEGSLEQKTKKGLYRKDDDGKIILDLDAKKYRSS